MNKTKYNIHDTVVVRGQIGSVCRVREILTQSAYGASRYVLYQVYAYGSGELNGLRWYDEVRLSPWKPPEDFTPAHHWED